MPTVDLSGQEDVFICQLNLNRSGNSTHGLLHQLEHVMLRVNSKAERWCGAAAVDIVIGLVLPSRCHRAAVVAASCCGGQGIASYIDVPQTSIPVSMHNYR